MFEFIFIFLTVLIAGIMTYDIPEKKRLSGIILSCNAFQFGLLGGLSAFAVSVAGLLFFAFMEIQALSNGFIAIFYGTLFIVSIATAIYTAQPFKNARLINESIFRIAIFVSASFAFFVTIGIIVSLTTETLNFFKLYPFWDFMLGLEWSPQTALRADQMGAMGKFGSVPLLVGTLLITTIALAIACPIGLGAAIYLSEFAESDVRRTIKPILEILAGVPTVVYGFFAALTVAPFIKTFGMSYGLSVSSESALAAGSVMGVMIVPYVCSLSDDVLHAVPQSLRDGSNALGATAAETVLRVVMLSAFPGIVSAFILAFSRAIGETMIVLMAAGLAGTLTFNPLDSVTTFTVQIGTLLTGDQAFNSVKTLSAFALGSSLFVTTLILNFFAVRTIRKYREKYA